jgi:hypothetical protein
MTSRLSRTTIIRTQTNTRYSLLGLEFPDPCVPFLLSVSQMFLHTSPRALLIHLFNGLKKPFMLFNNGINPYYTEEQRDWLPVP